MTAVVIATPKQDNAAIDQNSQRLASLPDGENSALATPDAPTATPAVKYTA